MSLLKLIDCEGFLSPNHEIVVVKKVDRHSLLSEVLVYTGITIVQLLIMIIISRNETTMELENMT